MHKKIRFPKFGEKILKFARKKSCFSVFLMIFTIKTSKKFFEIQVFKILENLKVGYAQEKRISQVW